MVGDGHAMGVAARSIEGSFVMTIGSIRSRRARTALLVVGVYLHTYNSPPERTATAAQEKGDGSDTVCCCLRYRSPHHPQGTDYPVCGEHLPGNQSPFKESAFA